MGLGSLFKRNKKKKTKEVIEESHIDIFIDECEGCEKCVIACPNNVLVMENDKPSVSNSFGCKRCKVCMAICPNDCIKVN